MHASSSRSLARALAFTLGLAAVPAVVAAEPPAAPPAPVKGAPAPKPPPVRASDEEAAQAVAEFKEAYKAKGLKGDEKLSQREFAMRTLAKLQHPLVVEALAPAAKESEPMLRMIGTIYLGDMTLFPGLAGKHLVAAWKRGVSDDAFVMTAMQSVAKLKFLGAREDIRGALKSQNFAVKKVAIGTIVATGDLRLVRDMLQLVGVQLPAAQGAASQNAGTGVVERGGTDSSGGAETTSEGYSWEGAEATVDWGLSDNTAENAAAQAQVEAQIAANQAAAAANSGGTGGVGGGGGGTGVGGVGPGGSAGGKGGGRSNAELIPLVLGALQRLTGQTFTGPAHFKRWWGENAEIVGDRMKKLDEKEKFQKEEATAQSK